MKRVIICILVIITCSAVFAQNRGPGSNVSDVSSIVGSPRGPVQGRTTRVNPYNPSIGNNIVTGNVGGGKHFRHTVPYASSSEFGSSLYDAGSQSVSSFMRRSAADPFTSGLPYYQSYYDPRTTVTSINRGDQSGLATPKNYSQVALPDYKLPQTVQSESQYYRRQPLSVPSARMEFLIKQQMGIHEIIRKDEFFRKTLDENLKDTTDPTRQIQELLLKTDRAEPQEPDQPDKTDIKNIEDIENELLNELLEPGKTGDSKQPEIEEDTNLPLKTEDKTPSEVQDSGDEQVDDILLKSADYYRNRARQILGDHKDIQSLAKAKTAEFVAQASGHMLMDRYYKASQAYELAMVWSQNNPDLHHDNALALFAAGSYLSASFQLDTAMRLDRDLMTKKIELKTRIPNRDTIEDRLIELNKLQLNTDSPFLSYLMAYITYRDGKIAQADEAIQKALKLLPDHPSMLALKNAIKQK